MRTFVLKCYAAWIDENIPIDEIMGNCTMWARVVHQAFPELILVGCYVHADDPDPDDFFPACPIFRTSYHEYLITEDGDIVDPTAKQFDLMMGKGKWFYNRCEEHLIYPGDQS